MHPVSISEPFESAPTDAAAPERQSGRELLRSGALGTQIVRLAQLAAQNEIEQTPVPAEFEEASR